MRSLFATVSCCDVVRGYADDLAAVLHSVWESGPRLSRLFERVAKLSCLVLNGKKCVFIPLWIYNEREVKDKIVLIIPVWSSFSVKSFGKYLGLGW